jgi:hypothetical protein
MAHPHQTCEREPQVSEDRERSDPIYLISY